jgi:hypothetical protein
LSQGEGGGRPTAYRTSFCKIAKAMVKLGATDREVAEALGVSEQTLYTWKHKHPKFLESLNVDAKKKANKRVEVSLFKRATGYSFDAEEIVPYDHVIEHKDAEGKTVRVERTKQVLRVPIVKHVPPDPTSIIYWSKNRDPDRWRDRRDVTLANPKGKTFRTEAVPAEPELIGQYLARIEAIAADRAVGDLAQRVGRAEVSDDGGGEDPLPD